MLQTAASLAELEGKAKDRLESARKDLARVSRSSLGKDARDQYDSAERFIRMAQDAIAAKNFVLRRLLRRQGRDTALRPFVSEVSQF